MSVPFFLLIFEKVFLCYFSVNLCISFSKVHLRLKLHIYSYLCRLFRMGGGEVEPSPPIWCKRTFFQKKKKNKNCGFCQVLCYGADIYSDDCVWVFFFVFFFVVRRKKKGKKSYVLMYVKAVRRVIKSRHCLYILYFVLLLSVIGFDFCHFLGT